MVEMMYILSYTGWSNNVYTSKCVTGLTYKTEACVFPELPGSQPDEPYWLPAKYAISGLYKAGVEIANSQRSFYQLEIGLILNEIQIGYLELRPKPSLPALQSDPSVNSTVLEINSSNSSLTAASGRITAKEDPQFMITYTYNGNTIKAQDLFTSFLNALAIASERDNADLKAFVPSAPAASGEVLLTTWEQGSGDGPAADKLTWERLKRAIQLLWEDVILCNNRARKVKPRFEDFQFDLWYGTDKIGGGRVWKFGAVGGEGTFGGATNGTGGTAISR